MDKPSRSTSATRSRSPRDSTPQNGRVIPEIFLQPTRDAMRPGQSYSLQSSSPSGSAPNTVGGDSTQRNPPDCPGTNPLLNDLRAVAADIRNTLSAAIADLKTSLNAMVGRVEEVEIVTTHHESSILQLQHSSDSHALHLRDLNQQMMDLDNRDGGTTSG